VHQGTVVRVSLRLSASQAPRVLGVVTIATGLAEQASSSAFVLGPTGGGLGRDGTLYVADTAVGTITVIPGTLSCADSAGPGLTVTSGGALSQPLGVAIAAIGEILTVNGGNGKIVETTPGGQQVATRYLDKSAARRAPRRRSASPSHPAASSITSMTPPTASACSTERTLTLVRAKPRHTPQASRVTGYNGQQASQQSITIQPSAPSSRQIVATAGALSGVTSKPGTTARARCVSNSTETKATVRFGRNRHCGGIWRQRERAYGPQGLAGDVQRLAAGGHDADLRAGGQDAVGQGGRGRDQVLAVVQDQQRALPGQGGAQPDDLGQGAGPA
jgi:hypothetical protein